MVIARAARCLIVGAAAVAVARGGTGTARADNPPIVDRNYAIDLYDGVAIGNTAMVGMGGAGAALDASAPPAC